MVLWNRGRTAATTALLGFLPLAILHLLPARFESQHKYEYKYQHKTAVVIFPNVESLSKLYLKVNFYLPGSQSCARAHISRFCSAWRFSPCRSEA